MEIEIVVQSGHSLQVNDVAFAPDGTRVATCSADESVRLWDLSLGCESAVLRGHTGPVYHVQWLPASDRLLSCGWDKTVRLWDVGARSCIRVFELEGSPVNTFALDPLHGHMAAGGSGIGDHPAPLRVWKLETGSLVHDLKIPQAATEVAFSPDGSLLAVADGGQNRLRMLNAETGDERFSIEGEFPGDRHTTAAALAFLADSRHLAHASLGQVRLLNVDNGTVVRSLDAEEDVTDLEVGPDGTLVAFGATSISIWDPLTGTRLETIAQPADAVSPDRTLLARRSGRHLELVDRDTGTPIRRLGTQLALPEFVGNRARQFPLAANPMHPILASGAPDGMIRLWDLRSGGAPRVISAHGTLVEALAFDPRGNHLASGGADGFIRFWRVRDGTRLGEVPFEGMVRSLVYRVRGGPLESATDLIAANADGAMAVLDAETCEVRAAASGGYEFGGLATTPWGETLTGSLDGLQVWDEAFAGSKKLVEDAPVTAVATAPDGRFAVAFGLNKWFVGFTSQTDPVIALQDPATKRTHRLGGHTSYTRDLAFSPDGTRLASGGGDGLLILTDAVTGERLHRIEAHAGDVTAVKFTADGRFVATAGLDGAIRLWQFDTGALAVTLVSLNDEDYVAVTGEGYYTATKTGLGSVMIRRDGRMLPFEQFDLRLNRPDRVLARLGFATRSTVAAWRQVHDARARRLGFDPDTAIDDTELPEVELLDVPSSGVARDRRIRLRAALHSRLRDLDRVMVYCNDVPVPGRRGVDVRALGRSGEIELVIDLAAGDNKIQVSAVDEAGAESLACTLRIAWPVHDPVRRLYALSIGVSRYADPAFDLDYAARDAADLLAEITRRQRRFADVETRLLTDGEATRAAILDAREFLMRSDVDDHIIILLAGHGTIEGGDYYFLPHDVDAEALAATAVTYDEIEGLLDGTQARRRLVLLDTCHSGEDYGLGEPGPSLAGGVREMRKARGAPGGAGTPGRAARRRGRLAAIERLPDLFADLRRESGAFVIAAAGAAEYAREFEGLENGVFTSCVIEALRDVSVDRNGDGRITVSELHHFVATRVTELTGGYQRPVSRRENLVDDFPVI